MELLASFSGSSDPRCDGVVMPHAVVADVVPFLRVLGSGFLRSVVLPGIEPIQREERPRTTLQMREDHASRWHLGICVLRGQSFCQILPVTRCGTPRSHHID